MPTGQLGSVARSLKRSRGTEKEECRQLSELMQHGFGFDPMMDMRCSEDLSVPQIHKGMAFGAS